MVSITKLKNELLAIPGWRTQRKILVIESDDWGSIRMPSSAVFERLTNKGLDLTSGDSLRYNRYDTLASAEDLEALYHVLKSVKDINGNHAVFTAVSLVANPDFDAMRRNHFESYEYEAMTETLKRYYPHTDVFRIWQQGIQEQLFVPQFHGREHLNVHAWMNALQHGDEEARLAFDEGLWGFANKHLHNVSFQAAFDLEVMDDIARHQKIIADGLKLFEQLFGYRASFFVPPNGVVHHDLYATSAGLGIDFMYSSKLNPMLVGLGKSRSQFNYLGKQNSVGQLFITRNAFFEPSQQDTACVKRCLRDIELAFRWNKPAIISSHRVNYIGALHRENRERGLTMLKELLNQIQWRWPEVEFMTTARLGQLMKGK